MRGDRLSALVPLARLKLAAALVLLSPYIPLLFMGEEYGEKAPFQYFVDYADPDLIEAVRKGRYEEFAAFAWEGETEDPQGEKVFLEAKIDVSRSEQAEHRPLFGFYRRLLALRKSEPALMNLSRASMQVTGYEEVKAFTVTRTCGDETVLVVYGVSSDRRTLVFSAPDGTWDKILDASEPQWGGGDEPAPAELAVEAGRGNIGINPFCVLVYKRR